MSSSGPIGWVELLRHIAYMAAGLLIMIGGIPLVKRLRTKRK